MAKRIIYHVTPKGEGKTAWLVNKAFLAWDKHMECLVQCRNPSEYKNFCEMWMYQYRSVCPIKCIFPTDTGITPKENSCLFIDEPENLSFIENPRFDDTIIYVTLNGELG